MKRFLLSLFLALVLPAVAFADYFSDAFNDAASTNINTRNTATGSLSWARVTNATFPGTGDFLTNGSGTVYSTAANTAYGVSSTAASANYVITSDVKCYTYGGSGTQATWLVRWDNSRTLYYVAWFANGSTQFLQIYRTVSGTFTEINAGAKNVPAPQQISAGGTATVVISISGQNTSTNITVSINGTQVRNETDNSGSAINGPGRVGIAPDSLGSSAGFHIDSISVAYPSMAAGTITESSTTSSSTTLTATAPSGGTGSYTYQWYRSTSSGFTPGGGNILSGQTSLTLNDSGLSASTNYYYKLVATDTDSPANTVTYTEEPVTTTGSSLTSGSITVNSYTNTTASLTVGTASGGTAPYTYQWYRSTSTGFTPGGGNIVSGATSTTLNDTGLSENTTYYYKCVVTDNVAATATSAESSAVTTYYGVTNTNLYFSPLNSESLGGSGTLQSNNVLPTGTTSVQWNSRGAYLKFKAVLTGTGSVSLLLDTTTQNGITTNAAEIGYYYTMLTSDYSASSTSPASYKLVYSTSTVTQTLGSSLPAGTYEFFVYVKGSALDTGTYTTGGGEADIFNQVNNVRVVGVRVTGGSLTTPAVRSNIALVLTDSIGGGYYVAGTSNASTSHDAFYAFVPSLMAGLDCEYGAVAFGGQGILKGQGNVTASATHPALYSATAANKSWDKYRQGVSRTSVTGQVTPNYVFIHSGTNDGATDVTTATTSLIADIRGTWSTSYIFILCNPMRTKASELSAGVTAASDSKAKYIDFPTALYTQAKPSVFSSDGGSGGTHPNALGSAFISSVYADRVLSAIGTGGARTTSF
jgi:hypothetical protein